MKKVFYLVAMAMMTAMMLTACSTSDDDPVQTPPSTPTPAPTPTPANPFLGTWNLVNDADNTVATQLVMSAEPYIDYSATYTAQNNTIPANCPTFTKTVKVTYTDGTAYFSQDKGYFTIPEAVTTTSATGETTSAVPTTGKITYWPQSCMTSNDGTTWTAVAAADMVKMEEYTYQLTGNIMVLTKGDKTTMTYIISKAAPTTATLSDFIKTWNLVNDADPTTVTELVLTNLPPTNPTATTQNPTIPANAMSYTKNTTVDPKLSPYYDPSAAEPATYTKVQGYFTLPDPVAPTGKITFWPQKTLTSSDGSTWTEETGQGTVVLEEYTYQVDGNVLVLKRADNTTLTYIIK